ncbi:hypothetical protein M0G43_15160 [Subsaxibacter sp. CAU 1640]|uniref:hypothetical protein n=1 Tax=Subsaxibacter sp. CAU 1640 TaxID=2933271 RepID=UPI002005CA21|nr:hypothetical protein [Subsaxibacter sp. CAU 1640]MCK7591925.1 hypothetical protein [Subsaxibacter sp. CAU 1640]
MTYNNDFYNYLKNHKRIVDFEYNLVIDWAVSLLMNGHNSISLAMIAGYSKPVDKEHMQDLVSQALKDLGISETEVNDPYDSLVLYHVTKIIQKQNIRKHLKSLYQISMNSDLTDCFVFYRLHHAWKDLEDDYVQKQLNGVQFYYEGATLDTIESLVIKEAQQWMDANY